MNEDKRFYWLKLKEDFFNTTEIKIMKSLPNGKDYIILLLQLRLLSINHNGLLRYNEYIPYDLNALSSLTDTNVDIVRTGIKLFEEMKLLSILDDGTFFMEKINELVGSESKWAKYKRQERSLSNEENLLLNDVHSNKLDNVQKMSNEVIGNSPTRDIEYKNITTTTQMYNNEKYQKIKVIFDKYLKFYNENTIYECINNYSYMDNDVIEKALIKSFQKDGSWLYAKSILESWKLKNIININQVNEEELEFQKSKKDIKKSKNKSHKKYQGREYKESELENMYDNL